MRESANGLAGKILHVNLTTGSVTTEPTVRYAAKFLGGRGINSWLLYQQVKPWVTPLEPANRLIIGTGALVGTLAPSAGRHNIDAKSPMTGGIGSSNSGGHFSAELKFAGYDHIVIAGRARKPVYLWLDDDRVQIRDASGIWGKRVSETNDLIKQELGIADIQILCIGPAGENLVRAACIITNRARAAARCGLGAVMGAKQLKAIAVRGSGAIRVAQPTRFMSEVAKAWEKLRQSSSAQRRRQWGTLFAATVSNNASLFPVRNFEDDYLKPESLAKISPQVFRQKYEVGRLGYSFCPVSCSHLYHIPDGLYTGLTAEGIECNDLWNFGGRLAIDYPPAIIKAHHLCSEYGLDQDNASGAIAWAMECYQRGILTRQDTDGLQLEWGNHEVVMELLRRIAYREGIGDILAEGAKRAAEIIGGGSDQFAVHLKGQDSIESMRAAKGWALGCVVSPRGGGHTRGANLIELYHDRLTRDFCRKAFGIPQVGNMLDYENKANLVVYFERLQAICDCLGICLLCSYWGGPDQLGPDDFASLYSAATGQELSASELLSTGERIHNVEKAFNVLHAGFARRDDYPPQRFMEEPVKSGPAKGELLVKKMWDKMLDEYYQLHGWDIETGWQSRRQLKTLSLTEVADDLEQAGKLAPNRI